MKLSWKWLHDFLPEQIAPERIAEILTAIGLEVENVVEYSSLGHDETWENCVVAEVREVKAHPNSSRLRIAMVDFGAQDWQQVVCGAPNLALGQKVVFAKEGAVLHTHSGKKLEIGRRIIAGVESAGMLCSEAELGISVNGAGIMILAKDAQVGMLAKDYLQVYQDILLDVAITPNRVDAMSHYAMAREILVYENYHNQQKRQLNNHSFARSISYSATPMEVKVANSDLCARYTGIGVKNVQIQPSPKWIQDRLRALGVRCINNIVDLTNYILLAYGNPIHAYDADKIQGRKICVRNAESTERITLLNKVEYKLNPEDILIVDAENNPLALAGIMGGSTSAISDETQAVFFEVAHFNSTNIKHTARLYGLNSEAALQFAKAATDVENTAQILKSLLYWLMEICPQAQIEGGCVDVITHNWEAQKIRLQYAFVERLSGKKYEREQIRKILMGLGFELLNETKEEMELRVPLHKQSIQDKYDIVEEIMRIDGLDNIPVAENYTTQIFPSSDFTSISARENLSSWQEASLDYLSALGWSEIMTNTIVDKANYAYTDAEKWVVLENPLSAVHNILRPDTLCSGLEAIAFNWKRQSRQARFFELGKQYELANGKYLEQELLSLWCTGFRSSLSWHGKAEPTDIYYLKGVLEALFAKWRILPEISEKRIGESALLIKAYGYELRGEIIATWGEVRAEHRAHFDLDEPVYFATLSLAKIHALIPQTQIFYSPVSAFPAITRDLSLLLPHSYAYSELLREIANLRIAELQQITLFDRFLDAKWQDKQSLALRFTFQSAEATFTDEQIKEFMQQILACLRGRTPAILRES